MNDVSMENVEGTDTRPTQDLFKEMVEFMNTRVFELLTMQTKDDQETIKHDKDEVFANYMRREVDANKYLSSGPQLRSFLAWNIRARYDVEYDVAYTVAKETIADVMKKYGLQTPPAPKLMQELEIAFTQIEYVGNASSKFREYIERCWEIYRNHSYKFKAPCVALVQSSGFGKSRMLFELARMALEPSSKIKVLYVCARTQESTGYPKATEQLQMWLFPTLCNSETIATQLKVIFHYAVDNWKTVQEEWLQLFTSPDADFDVENKLESYRRKMMRGKKTSTFIDASGKVVIVVIDEARSLLTEGQDSLNRFHMLQQALDRAIAKNGGIFGVLVNTNSETPDHTKLRPREPDPDSWRIKSESLASFPPFVLTHTMDVFWQEYCNEQAVRDEKVRNSDERVVEMQDEAVEAADEMADDQMSDSEESQRDGVKEIINKACDGKKEMSADETAYKDAVTGSEQDAWNVLVRMGRPMWYSTFTNVLEDQTDVVSLAAKKLLLGRSPGPDSYTEYNMFGIASLLCRVGLRPYSTALFAPRAVADFMAILAHVNYEKEGYVSSYASDPVLTLGAMKVWYGLRDALADFILPQLKRLMMNKVLDTGRIGVVVARIVLLLAMDKCVIGGKTYTGQFISVRAFLEAFGVEEMAVCTSHMCATSDAKDAFRTWLSKWDGWRMGFTHFVQLKLKPTEGTLWYLLGRRAAGIFPRNKRGVDLLIPIFWTKIGGEAAFEPEMKTENAVDAKVSLILVQVKNRPSHESGFSQSVTTKLRPSFVFGEELNNSPVRIPSKGSNEESVEGPSITKLVEDPPITKLIENPLSKKSIRDVVCFYMNVQGEDSKHHRFTYAEKCEDENKSNDGGTNVGELKTHDGKPKAGDSKAESAAAASGSNDSKTKAASELMFTFCYHSVRSDTYKFLDAKVAGRLASLLETQCQEVE